MSDKSLEEVIDVSLQNLDVDNDGYISYYEYVSKINIEQDKSDESN